MKYRYRLFACKYAYPKRTFKEMPTEWRTSKPPGFCSGSFRFEFWPRHRLFIHLNGHDLETFGIQDVRSKLKQNLINHLERMINTRLPKHTLNYKPRGRRDRIVDVLGNDGNVSMPDKSFDLVHEGIWWDDEMATIVFFLTVQFSRHGNFPVSFNLINFCNLCGVLK